MQPFEHLGKLLRRHPPESLANSLRREGPNLADLYPGTLGWTARHQLQGEGEARSMGLARQRHRNLSVVRPSGSVRAEALFRQRPFRDRIQFAALLGEAATLESRQLRRHRGLDGLAAIRISGIPYEPVDAADGLAIERDSNPGLRRRESGAGVGRLSVQLSGVSRTSTSSTYVSVWHSATK